MFLTSQEWKVSSAEWKKLAWDRNIDSVPGMYQVCSSIPERKAEYSRSCRCDWWERVSYEGSFVMHSFFPTEIRGNDIRGE